MHPRLLVADMKKTSCPECQQADSAVGIWTDLPRVLMLGLGARVHTAVTTYKSLFPKTCLPNAEAPDPLFGD
jgi:hypothetical protein